MGKDQKKPAQQSQQNEDMVNQTDVRMGMNIDHNDMVDISIEKRMEEKEQELRYEEEQKKEAARSANERIQELKDMIQKAVENCSSKSVLDNSSKEKLKAAEPLIDAMEQFRKAGNSSDPEKKELELAFHSHTEQNEDGEKWITLDNAYGGSLKKHLKQKILSNPESLVKRSVEEELLQKLSNIDLDGDPAGESYDVFYRTTWHKTGPDSKDYTIQSNMSSFLSLSEDTKEKIREGNKRVDVHHISVIEQYKRPGTIVRYYSNNSKYLIKKDLPNHLVFRDDAYIGTINATLSVGLTKELTQCDESFRTFEGNKHTVLSRAEAIQFKDLYKKDRDKLQSILDKIYEDLQKKVDHEININRIQFDMIGIEHSTKREKVKIMEYILKNNEQGSKLLQQLSGVADEDSKKKIEKASKKK